MIQRLVNAQKTNQVAGLQVEFTQVGEMACSYVVLNLKKQIISIHKTGQANSIEEVLQQIETNTPIVIVVDGKGVLHKPFGKDLPTDPNQLAQVLLPGIKVDEMYLQVEASILSFARRNLIDDIIIKLKTQGFDILNISFGPFCLAKVVKLTQSNNQEDTIEVGGYTLNFGNNNLISFLKTDYNHLAQYTIGTDNISQTHINAYSAAFSWFMGNYPQIVAQEITSSREEYFYKKFFNKLFIGLIVTLFVILLGNYIIFEIERDKNVSLQAKDQVYSGKSTKLIKIRKELKEKETFLDKAGWMTSSKLSFYADRIAATLPNSISLNELSINPEDEKLTRDNRKLTLRPGTIQVIGMCGQPTDLNRWISDLDQLRWVSGVQMVSYTYDNKTRKGTFKLEITIKTDKGDF